MRGTYTFPFGATTADYSGMSILVFSLHIVYLQILPILNENEDDQP